MALATFSVRMDESLKRQFDALCSEFGMNATTAFNVFARAVVREKESRLKSRHPAISQGRVVCRHLWHFGHRRRKTVCRTCPLMKSMRRFVNPDMGRQQSDLLCGD